MDPHYPYIPQRKDTDLSKKEIFKIIDYPVSAIDIPSTILSQLKLDFSFFNDGHLIKKRRKNIISEGFKPKDIISNSQLDINKFPIIAYVYTDEGYKSIYQGINLGPLFKLDKDFVINLKLKIE